MIRRKHIILVALLALVALAGCGEPTPAEQRENEYESAMSSVGHEIELRAGESIGVERAGDEHWQILVTDVTKNHTNISARKIVADEVGQNKEGIDPTYTFNRTYIDVGELELLESHLKVAVLDIDSGEARIVVGNWDMGQSEIDTIIEYRNSS